MKKLVTLAVVVCLLALAAGSATAATKTWNVSSGNWNVSGNWNPSGIPASGDEARIVNSGGKPTIPSGYNTANLARAYVYNATTPTLTVKGTLNITSSGQYMKVGFGSVGNAPGRLVMNLSTAVINLANGCDLYLGDGYTSRYTGSTGYFDFQKGTLNCDEVILGNRGASGTIVQSLDQATANVGFVTIGADTAIDCLYDLQAGSLTCTGMSVTQGTFHQAIGSTVAVNGNMDVGANGKVNVDITGSGNSYIPVTGNITVHTGATLNVNVSGFTPSYGQEFTILECISGGTLNNTFTNVTSNWTTQTRDGGARLVAIYVPTPEPLKAFPGAYGFGCQASGGRGGSVYKVTNLNNDGSGSFRDAVKGGSTRTIIFNTGGTVNLDTRVDSTQANLTVAGQTAPGGGFCVRNGQLMLRNTDNWIVRYLRFRLGDHSGTNTGLSGFFDTVQINGSTNVIFDHSSLTWGMSTTCNMRALCTNITLQWCLFAEGLHNDTTFGYGVIEEPNSIAHSYITMHHNLMASFDGRNPRASNEYGGDLLSDTRYNVIYNWGTGGDFGAWATRYSGETCNMNWVGNYSIAGPSTTSNASTMLSAGSSQGDIYISGDKVDSNRNGSLDGSNATWSNVSGGTHSSEFTIGSSFQVPSDTADSAYTNVISGVGATKPSRDSCDTRIVNTVTNQNGGIISSQDNVGGWPTLAAGSAPTDTDGDGMPDAWESANGTNPNVADNNGDIDGDGYTNLEEYINSL